MQLSDFDYDLPEELIAQHPLPERTASRLLTLDAASGALADRQFRDLPSLLRPGDLLVMNDTRVIRARLFGTKETGGAVEILLERVVSDEEAVAQIRASKTPKPGMRIDIEGSDQGLVVIAKQEDGFYLIRTEGGAPLAALLEAHGHMPLPPYIERDDAPEDLERYQTVFARRPGAVAAPTAGLHFDEALLKALVAGGIETATLTLHVGAGTFQPVRVDNVDKHVMHAERVEVSAALIERINATHAAGGRVVATGTTCVRALEAAAAGGELVPYTGETRLFIRPGFEFRVVDALITNFHLPRSTLMMLIAAFGGYEHVMAAYRHAVAERYRFFSYGDAMFIDRGGRG